MPSYDPSSLDPSLFEPIDGTEPFVEPHYSSWDGAQHGPEPRPDWVVTEFAAVDTELGVLKTGKEADVHLVHRDHHWRVIRDQATCSSVGCA